MGDTYWRSNTRQKETIVAVSLLVFVVGCATSHRPLVWVEQGVSLSRYKAFEVTPALNETGQTFDFEVADTLTQYIQSGLKEKGYILAEGSTMAPTTLMVTSRLITYEPGNVAGRMLGFGGQARCILRSALIEKDTGKMIAEVVSAQETQSGGLLGGAVGVASAIGAGQVMLHNCATAIVEEIDRRFKGD